MILQKSQGPSCGLSSCGPAQLIPSKGAIQELYRLGTASQSFWCFKSFVLVVVILSFCDNKEGAQWLWELWSKEISWEKKPSNWNHECFLLFPHWTGWQDDVRRWTSICEYQLKAQNSLTCWLLELNLAVYKVSIKDSCKKKTLFSPTHYLQVFTTQKSVSKSLPAALILLLDTKELAPHVIWLLKYYHSNRHQFYGSPLPFLPTAEAPCGMVRRSRSPRLWKWPWFAWLTNGKRQICPLQGTEFQLHIVLIQ